MLALASMLAAHTAPALATAPAPLTGGSGHLVVGVSHLVPPYQAGAKFRTPESIESALVEELAAQAKATPVMREVNATGHATLPPANQADILFRFVPQDDPLTRSPRFIPTGYAAGPMAIMRTDTNIKTWQHLKGRTVCVSEGSPYKGAIAAQYGAIEKIFPAPADSLLALRIGGCDAAVHDSTMLEQLLALPEWKKFSARLPTGPQSLLGFVVPDDRKGLTAAMRQLSNHWKSTNRLAMLNEKRVRHIAFEVYLDQNVPDCH